MKKRKVRTLAKSFASPPLAAIIAPKRMSSHYS